MNEYRQEHLRRQRAEMARQKEEAAAADVRNEKRRTAILLAATVAALVAMLAVLPARFLAIAGEDIDPVEQYLMSHVTQGDLEHADAEASELVATAQIVDSGSTPVVTVETEAPEANVAEAVPEAPVEGNFEASAEGINAAAEVEEASAVNLLDDGSEEGTPSAAVETADSSLVDFSTGTFLWDANGDGIAETYALTFADGGVAAPSGYTIALQVPEGEEGSEADAEPAPVQCYLENAYQISDIRSLKDENGAYLLVNYITGTPEVHEIPAQCQVRLRDGILIVTPTEASQDEEDTVYSEFPADGGEISPDAGIAEVDAGTGEDAQPTQETPEAPVTEVVETNETPAPVAETPTTVAPNEAYSVDGGGIMNLVESIADSGQESKFEKTDRSMLVKFLLVDKDFVTPETTIGTLYDRDDFDLSIIAQFSNTIPMLDPGEDSDCLVALIDTSKFSGYGTVTYADFALMNVEGQTINEFVTYDIQDGIAYIPKLYFDCGEGEDVPADLPVQAQLLVSYDLDAKGTEDAGVEIPVSITSELSGVATSGATSFFGYNFDTSVTIPVVAPGSAGAVSIENILVYDGGSEMPMDLSGGFAQYDNETGELTLQLNATTLTSLKIKIVGTDIATQLLDSVTKPVVAEAATNYDNMKAWKGSLTALNTKNFETAVSQKYVYHYNTPLLKTSKAFLTGKKSALETDWLKAIIAASDYMYAPNVQGPSKNNEFAYDIYTGKSIDEIFNSNKYTVTCKPMTNAGAVDKAGRNTTFSSSGRAFYSYLSGGIESGFGLPGYSAGSLSVSATLSKGRTKANRATNKALDDLPDLNLSGLQTLDNAKYLIADGVCTHIESKNSGELAKPFSSDTSANNITKKEYVYARPLYSKKDSSTGYLKYVVFGFVTGTKGTQQGSGIYKFNVQGPGYAKVKKTSSNTGVSNGNTNYAVNMKGATYGIYSSLKAAQDAKIGAKGSPVAEVTFDGTKAESSTAMLKPGTYWAKEIVAPAGYAANTNVVGGNGGLTVAEGKTVTFETTDAPLLGSLTVQKKDVETKNPVKKGSYKFVLYNSQKKKVGEQTAKDKDTVKWDNLAFGTYYVREEAASYPYMTDVFNVGDSKSWHQVDITQAKSAVSFVIEDTQRRGEVTLTKTDGKTNKPLAGAKFSLYASQDVTSLDGTKRHTKDAKVAVTKVADGDYKVESGAKTTELVTNANGVIKVTGLYLTDGASTDFYMKEDAAPTGYLLDTTKLDIKFAKDESKKVLTATLAKPNTPNGIDIYTKDKRDESNIANKVMGVWKKEDSVSVTTDAATDALAIRTPDNNESYKPTLVPLRASSAQAAAAKTESIAAIEASVANGMATEINVVVKSWFTDNPVLYLTAQPSASAEQMLQSTNMSLGAALAMLGIQNENLDTTTGSVKISGPGTYVIYAAPDYINGYTVTLKDKSGQTIEHVGDKNLSVKKEQTTLYLNISTDGGKHGITFSETEATSSGSGSSSTTSGSGSTTSGSGSTTSGSGSTTSGSGSTTSGSGSTTSGSGSTTSGSGSTTSGSGDTQQTTSLSKDAKSITATWDANQKAWIAKGLLPNTVYKVEMGTTTVKELQTSAGGGVVHFGRYSTTASDMFAKGWLDQSGLAKDDSKLVYKGLTDTNGHLGFQTIPAGEYVIGEIKPPVDATGHYTYLVDTNAHNFKVDSKSGLISDTDDTKTGYHDADASKETATKAFTFKEDVTRLRLSKCSTEDGNKEIEGAQLVLTDSERVVIAEWTSTTTAHAIDGLAPGNYWLSEKQTPQNYEHADSIQIRLLPTGEVQHVKMYDAPIVVRVSVDKRQEIADPLDERYMENGDGKNEAALSVSPDGYYDYSLDARNSSNSWVDEFTFTDELPAVADGMARLVSIETPQAWQDYDGKMNVWYKTNKTPEDYEDDAKKVNATKSDGHENLWLTNNKSALDPDGDGRLEDFKGWKLWKENISTMATSNLKVEDLELAADEYVTGIRFEYGRVESGFTTRANDWDETLIKKAHDDWDDILNAERMTFESADAAADAAASQLSSLVDLLATKASREAEADIKERNASEAKRYQDLVDSIAEYNAALPQDTELPRKFIDAVQKPAYEGDDEPGQKLIAARDAAKLSLQAILDTAETAEGKIALAKSLPSLQNALTALVSDETAKSVAAQVSEYVKGVDMADPESIVTAEVNIKDAASNAIDEFVATALAGRVHYAPAILHMQVTEAYVAGETLSNSASAIASRNGGGAGDSDSDGQTAKDKGDPENPGDPSDPEDPGTPNDPNPPLIYRDTDTNSQSAKERVITLDTNLAAPDGSKTITVESGMLNIVDKVHYTGLTVGKEYVMSGEIHSRHGEGVDAGVVQAGGKPVATQIAFVPTSEDGDVEVPFTIDVSELHAYPAVAFETLYEGFSGKAGSVELASHKDINDADQTMSVNPIEDDIIIRTQGKGSSNPVQQIFNNRNPLAQTGDPVVILSVGILVAAAIVGIVIWRHRNNA